MKKGIQHDNSKIAVARILGDDKWQAPLLDFLLQAGHLTKYLPNQQSPPWRPDHLCMKFVVLTHATSESHNKIFHFEDSKLL